MNHSKKFMKEFHLNSGFYDGLSDIENKRPRKWDYAGELISILDQRKGFSKKHFNMDYVEGYCKAYKA